MKMSNTELKLCIECNTMKRIPTWTSFCKRCRDKIHGLSVAGGEKDNSKVVRIKPLTDQHVLGFIRADVNLDIKSIMKLIEFIEDFKENNKELLELLKNE